MLSSLRNSERIFRRSILLPAVFLLAIGYTVYQRCIELNLYFTYSDFAYYILRIRNGQSLSIVYYILFLFISFEFVYKLRGVYLSECCRTIPGSKPKIYLGQLSFLFLLAFSTSVLHFAFDMIFYLTGLSRGLPVFLHILNLSLLNVLLVCVVAILIGALLGIYCNRYGGYTALITVVLVSTPISDSLLAYFSMVNPVFYRVKNFFSFLPVNINYDNAIAGGSAEASRWNVAFFWICLLGAVFLFTQYRKAVKKVVPLCLCAALLLTAGYHGTLFATANDLLVQDRPDAIDDISFHSHNPGKEKKAEFTVTGYRMDLDLRRKFSADCTVFLDNNDLTEYDFTLSYAYTLHSITDKQGRPLSYVRDGDYLTVQNPYSSGLSEIHLSYSGNNTTYFVNNQQILLPAYYPYYPFAGFKPLFFNDLAQGPLTDTVDENLKSFDVSIQSSVPFVTNLTQKDGRYTGSSEGLTIVGGLLEFTEVDGTPVMRTLAATPLSSGTDVSWVGGIQSELTQLYDYLQVPEPERVTIDGKTLFPPVNIFLTPGIAEECSVYSDHIVFTNSSFYEHAKYCASAILAADLKLNREQYLLQELFFKEYLLMPEEFDASYADITQAYEQEYAEYRKEMLLQGHLLYELKQRLGEQQAAIAVYNYLCDENDARTPQQFLEEALA